MIDFHEDLKEKLAAIAAAPRHWSETPILRHNGGMLADAERFAREGRWWTRDPSGVRDLSAVNELLERVGVGRLRDDTDPDFERRRDVQKEKNEKYESRTSASELAESQRDRAKRRREGAADEESWEKYLPGPNDHASRWCDDLAKRVDCTKRDVMPWYGALRAYVSKFPANAIARDLDQETVAKLLKQICSN